MDSFAYFAELPFTLFSNVGSKCGHWISEISRLFFHYPNSLYLGLPLFSVDSVLMNFYSILNRDPVLKENPDSSFLRVHGAQTL